MSKNNYRQRRIAKGLCPSCGEKNDRDAYYCSTCLVKHNEKARRWAERKRLDKVCPKCGGELDLDTTVCSSCLEEIARKAKKRREERRAQSLCVSCGKVSVKDSDFVVCEDCLDAKRERGAELYNKRKDRKSVV